MKEAELNALAKEFVQTLTDKDLSPLNTMVHEAACDIFFKVVDLGFIANDRPPKPGRMILRQYEYGRGYGAVLFTNIKNEEIIFLSRDFAEACREVLSARPSILQIV